MTENSEKKLENIPIVEKNIHRTNLRRLIDTLYLFVPIALAFAGCFSRKTDMDCPHKKGRYSRAFPFSLRCNSFYNCRIICIYYD